MRVRSWRENVTSLRVSLGFEVEVSTTNLELLLCYLDPNWMKVIVIATPTNKVRLIDGKKNLEIVSPCILGVVVILQV